MKLQVLILLLLALQAVAINKIVRKGNKFFDSVTGLQFYIKGVAYQPASDPIADIAGLQKDIPLLTAAGVNVIRCYQTDWLLNHDEGMNLLAQAGIYVIIDLGDPRISVSYRGPWSTAIFENYRRKVDAFIKYTNTLGYFGGNEVILLPGSTINAPFVKAAIRDTKTYIKSKGYDIPVGYAGADVQVSSEVIDYLNCNNPDESVDFYGLNVYSWCNAQNAQEGNYLRFQKYSTYSVPFMFSEYGCNTNLPRTFNEVQSIYGSDLEDSLSGALVYEWSQEVNKYGLVSIDSNGNRTPLPDYTAFKNQLTSVKPKQLQMSSYTATYPQQQCPAVTDPEVYDSSTNWMAAATPTLPPTPNNPACQCMFSQLQCRTTSELYDYTVEDPNRWNQLETVKNSACSQAGVDCHNANTLPQYGSYGLWSMCNPYEITSYFINEAYLKGYGCSSNVISVGIFTPNNTGVDCSSTPNNYNSYNVITPGADPISGQPIGNGGGSSNTEPAGPCGAGLSQCGTACYSSSSYCCSAGQLYPAGQCPTDVTSSTTSSTTAAASSQGSSSNQDPATTSSNGTPTPASTTQVVQEQPQPSTSTTNDVGVSRAQSSGSALAISSVILTACLLLAMQ